MLSGKISSSFLSNFLFFSKASDFSLWRLKARSFIRFYNDSIQSHFMSSLRSSTFLFWMSMMSRAANDDWSHLNYFFLTFVYSFNSPSSYFETKSVWCSFNLLFSSHNLVMIISLSISKFGRRLSVLVWSFGAVLLSRIGGDIDDTDEGERLLRGWLRLRWNDFALSDLVKIGMELRRIGESTIVMFLHTKSDCE